MTARTRERVPLTTCQEAILNFMTDDPGWYSPYFIAENISGRYWKEEYVNKKLKMLYAEGKLLRRVARQGYLYDGFKYDYTLAPPGTLPPTKHERQVSSNPDERGRKTQDATHCQHCGEELPVREKGKPGPGRLYCIDGCQRKMRYEKDGK